VAELINPVELLSFAIAGKLFEKPITYAADQLIKTGLDESVKAGVEAAAKEGLGGSSRLAETISSKVPYIYYGPSTSKPGPILG